MVAILSWPQGVNSLRPSDTSLQCWIMWSLFYIMVDLDNGLLPVWQQAINQNNADLSDELSRAKL